MKLELDLTDPEIKINLDLLDKIEEINELNHPNLGANASFNNPNGLYSLMNTAFINIGQRVYELKKEDNKKIKFKIHTPNFVSPEENEKLRYYSDMEDFFNDSLIKKWTEKEGFYRFSKDTQDIFLPFTTTILAEFDHGNRWYVLGYLNIDADLPIALCKKKIEGDGK